MSMATIDDQGRCLSHPFVQLQRLSPRTGEWKALLDSCPLCTIDNKSTSGDNSSVCDSSYCSSAIVGYDEAEESNPLVVTPTLVRKGGGSDGKDSRSRSSRSSRRDRARSPPQRRRSTSRVRFGETTQATAASSTAEDGNPCIDIVPSASELGASQSLSGLSNMNMNMNTNMEHNLTGHDNSSASVSSQCSQLTKSVLKALPKYKSCKKKMQAQLDLSEKQRITTMSMDLSLEFSMDDESSSDEEEENQMNEKLEEIEREAGLVDINEKKMEELEKRLSEIEREAGLVEVKMEKMEDLILPQNKKVETRLREEESELRSTRKKDSGSGSGSSSRRHRSTERSRGSSLSKTKSNSFHGSGSLRSSSISSISKSKSNSFHDSSGSSRTPSSSKQRSSSVQIQRPDPEEFPCNVTSVCQSQSLESQDNRRQKRQSHPSQPQPQQRQVSRQGRAMSLTQQRPKDQLCQPPPLLPSQPPFQTSMVHSMQLQASRKTFKINSMQLQASPSPGSNSSRHVQQPIHTNMVVSPAHNYDDEISTLSYMGNSVQSVPSVTLRRHQYEDIACTDSTDDQDATNTATSTSPSVPRINTNDYDAKGRCIHHPHIRLRKKKLFGRGWKIQMSACPDCCVDELRRIRMVDQNKNRMKEKKERKRSKSANVDGSERSTGTGDRSLSSRGSRGSGHNGSSLRNSIRSIGSHPQPLQPQPSASIRSTGSQQQSLLTHISHSSSSSHNSMSTPKMVGASSSGNYSIPNPSGTSMSKPHPLPPPRHSPSAESTNNAMRHTSQNQRSSASLQRRSPSQESNINSSSKMMLMTAKNNANKKNTTLRRPSDGTASLTGSSSGSSNEMLDNSNRTDISNIQASSNPTNIQLPTRRPSVDLAPTRNSSSGSTRSSRSKSKGKSNNSSHQDAQQQQQQGQVVQQHQQGTIHVRQMQWIDPKNQKSGTYTGQVTAQFVPHGHGTMEYDDSTTGTASREGKWKNGRFRSKSSSVSKSSGKSSPGSNSRVAGSKSMDIGEGEARSRSRSVARQHRSASRSRVQPHQQEVAV